MLENFANNPERWFDVSWDTDKANEVHIGRIKLLLSHEHSSLATVTQIIAKSCINISNLKVINRSNDFFELILDLEVAGLNQLKNIIASLRSKSCVHSAERYRVQ
jgi:GTP pyrophosphokinase